MNPKHQLFCDTYLANGRNATKAYMSVYQCKNEDTARKSGARLSSNVDICAFLSEKTQKHSHNLGITLQTQLEGLNKVKELAMLADDRGKRDLRAYTQAIEIQNKMLGLNEPSKIELTGKDGGAIKADNQLTIRIIKGN